MGVRIMRKAVSMASGGLIKYMSIRKILPIKLARETESSPWPRRGKYFLQETETSTVSSYTQNRAPRIRRA
jgi:hypothetical protein